MTTEIANDDLSGVDVDLTLIRPLHPLPGSGLQFDPKEMQAMREIGRARAKDVLF
jgi:hypothetical protein